MCVHARERKREVGGHVSEGHKSAIHVLIQSASRKHVQTHMVQVNGRMKWCRMMSLCPLIQSGSRSWCSHVSQWGRWLRSGPVVPPPPPHWHIIREFLFIEAPLTCGLCQGDLYCVIWTHTACVCLSSILHRLLLTFHKLLGDLQEIRPLWQMCSLQEVPMNINRTWAAIQPIPALLVCLWLLWKESQAGEAAPFPSCAFWAAAHLLCVVVWYQCNNYCYHF